MNFYVIDHPPLVAEALARMLRNMCPQCQVVVAGDAHHLHTPTRLYGPPDVLILNDLAPELRNTFPHAVIIVFSPLSQAHLEQASLDAGAALFIRQDTKVNTLFQRLAKTLIAHFPMRSQQIRTKPRLLTVRQMQLLFAIETGATNLEMASMLGLSPHTIKVHLWRMFQRFGVNSRLQLLRYAYDHGMV
jgi:DNA-binding NarL/FixJ family response regulator